MRPVSRSMAKRKQDIGATHKDGACGTAGATVRLIRMGIKRICNRCGRIYEAGTNCGCKKRKSYAHTDWYNTPAWKATRDAVRIRDYDMDRLLLLKDRIEWPKELQALKDITVAVKDDRKIVHHIEPREENPDRIYDLDNLITVKASTHELIHLLYKTELKQATQDLLRQAVEYRY